MPGAFEKQHGLGVIFDATGNGDGLPVPEEVKVALYRILQESLNNAKKHTQAHEVVIALDLQPDQVTLTVLDDGVGFEVPPYLGAQVTRGHLGLVGMRERAAQVRGTFDMESKPGQGTWILVEVPWPPG